MPNIHFNTQLSAYQHISPSLVDTKIASLHDALNKLKAIDGHLLGSSLLGSVGFFGLSSFINMPFALIVLACVTPMAISYANSSRLEASDEVQTKLTELVTIYQALTQQGFSDTHNPIVLKILSAIAPYVSTQKLCHWYDLTVEFASTSVDAPQPHPAFLELLAKPPHGLVYINQQPDESEEHMHERLLLKSDLMARRYSFWDTAAAQIKQDIYGLESYSVPSPA